MTHVIHSRALRFALINFREWATSIFRAHNLSRTASVLRDFLCFSLSVQKFPRAKVSALMEGGIRGFPFPDFPEDYVQISRIPEDKKISNFKNKCF